MQTLAVPEKYREIGTFWRYYSGQAKAPIPTIFIGGNHEASGYLQELFYGGWVAPNIYYLGAAGVVRFGGLRIGGLSGIYKSHDFAKGRYEMPPYDKGTLRSVYHVRNVEVYRMKCLRTRARASSEETSEGDNQTRRPLDIMLSHDWPRGIERHGDTASLLRKKKFFRQEVEDNTLGSPANEDVLHTIKPRWWFSAHLHVKFEATVRHSTIGGDTTAEDRKRPAEATAAKGLVPSQIAGSSTANTADNSEQAAAEHDADDNVDDGRTTSFIGLESSTCPTESSIPDLTEQMTRFLSLDKCLPRRQHLQIVNIPILSDDDTSKEGSSDDGDLSEMQIEYDPEWLAILCKTHNLSQLTRSFVDVPADITPVTQKEIEEVQTRLIERRRQRSGGDGNDNEGESIETSDSNHERNAFAIPQNFCITVPPHGSPGSDFAPNGGAMVGNPQTDELLDLLGLEHVLTVPYTRSGLVQARPPTPPPHPIMQLTPDDNEIDLDDDEDGEEEKQANVQEVVVEPEIDDNEINLDDDDDEDEMEGEDDDDEEDVQTKKARTGSIVDLEK